MCTHSKGYTRPHERLDSVWLDIIEPLMRSCHTQASQNAGILNQRLPMDFGSIAWEARPRVMARQPNGSTAEWLGTGVCGHMGRALATLRAEHTLIPEYRYDRSRG